MSKVKRALISLTNKEGIVEFAQGLNELGVEIISTGGTAKKLQDAGIPITRISDFTGFPEMLDGRVKTLHPKVHGGLLGLRNKKSHVDEMEKHDIKPIDMVVVNLYAFEQVVQENNVPLEKAIENIDIGGPSMLRSAAKNYKDVIIVVDPSKYNYILESLKENNGSIPEDVRLKLACEVFELTSHYDSIISSFLQKRTEKEASQFPEKLDLSYKKRMDLRYGENPHQKAAFYQEINAKEESASTAKQIWGKELSFNNIIDIDGALETVKEFTEPAAVIIKHTNPCGVAVSDTIENAFIKAWATDPVSAFGSVIGLNRPVNKALAEEIAKYFVEGVIATGFNDDALQILQKKKNIRLMIMEGWNGSEKISRDIAEFDIKKVVGGLLLQDRDLEMTKKSDLKTVTKRKPSEDELKSLLFAWKVVKHVKSNAIVYAKEQETVGIGAGQMSRVDSSKIGVMKAFKDVKGSVMASDAFFPFRDNIDAAHEAGITAIIQPGGSIRDEEVIQACDDHGISMVFTGMRHFRH